ncbi:sugar ABC transporter substrate-binding protein [Amycolatopsis sulphurea]|uniref:sugar ABC transporter substrate-binding protein n=1 Tax=Amycolatopsis sulphurea TaxID=76022 RepID=UPI001472D52F|nr:substrate-binding domain-containing protein [Amycolatopsis sulphurea]
MLVTTGLVLALGLTAAACGSSAGGSGTQVDQAGLQAAKDYLAQNTRNPTSIGMPELPARPPAGKKFIMLQVSPMAIAQRVANGMKAASGALDWNFTTINAGGTPAEAVRAFEAALAQNPDVICPCGTASSMVFKDQIAEAKRRGITVVQNVVADGPIDGVLANVAGAPQQELYGKLVAAEFIVGSAGTGKAAVFNLNSFPILEAFTKAFEAAVKQWCPACSVDYNNQQLSDVGTKTPANVVAYLQRHPDVKWTVFGNGDLALGVSTAVKTSGLQGVNIIGESPSKANLEAVKSGTETAWAGYPVEMMAWRTVDAVARHFAGAHVDEGVSIPLPGQIITKDTVAGLAVENGEYVAVTGYQNQFRHAWKVG